MILVSNKENQEVAVDSVGIIKGCRVNLDGKIEFKIEINKQKIWVPASNVFELPSEKDFITKKEVSNVFKN